MTPCPDREQIIESILCDFKTASGSDPGHDHLSFGSGTYFVLVADNAEGVDLHYVDAMQYSLREACPVTVANNAGSGIIFHGRCHLGQLFTDRVILNIP